MKSSAFAYERPDSVEQALAAKVRWGGAARFLAGGQSLMPAMNMRLNQSECLIDLNGLVSLRAIRQEGELLVIGAMACHADVALSPLVRRAAPVLVQAGRYLAHVAIRNRGTFGGSVALADPAGEWPAACLLLDARIRLQGKSGHREIVAERFFQGLYMTDMGENDLLESVAIPFQHPEEKSCVLELARRHGDFATAAVMTRGRVRDGKISYLRMVFYGVADTALRDVSLDASIEKMVNQGALLDVPEAVQLALASRNLHADLYTAAHTKRYLCGVLARRAVAQLVGSGFGGR